MSTITIPEQEYRELCQKLVEVAAEHDLMLKILCHQLPEDGSSIEVPIEAIVNDNTSVGIRVNWDRRAVEVKRVDETKEPKSRVEIADEPRPLFVQQLSFPFEEV